MTWQRPVSLIGELDPTVDLALAWAGPPQEWLLAEIGLKRPVIDAEKKYIQCSELKAHNKQTIANPSRSRS